MRTGFKHWIYTLLIFALVHTYIICPGSSSSNIKSGCVNEDNNQNPISTDTIAPSLSETYSPQELLFYSQKLYQLEDKPLYSPLPEYSIIPISLPSVFPETEDVWVEGRALWVCRKALTSTESIVRLVEEAEAANFNTLFVQVRGAGDAYYLSTTEPRPFSLGLWPDDADPLQMVIFLAHRKGLQVHAWLNVLYGAPGYDYEMAEEHILQNRPEWVLIGRDLRSQWDYTRDELKANDSEGLYLNPFYPQVGDYICEMVKEILDNYSIDGIHLDFIRFPNIKFGYGPHERERFQEMFSVDPIELAYWNLSDDPTANLAHLWLDIHLLQWYAFRANAVDEVVRKVSLQMAVSRPECILSAAVWADPSHAYRYVGQDWLRWAAEGWVDLLCPMAYWNMPYGRLTELYEQIEAVGGCAYMGLGSYMKGEKTIVAEIEEVRESGAEGFSLFSYNDMVKDRPLYLYNLQQMLLSDRSSPPGLNYSKEWYLRWHPYFGPPQTPVDYPPSHLIFNYNHDRLNTDKIDVGDAEGLITSSETIEYLAGLSLIEGFTVSRWEVELLRHSIDASEEKASAWEPLSETRLAQCLLAVKLLDEWVYPKINISSYQVELKYKKMNPGKKKPEWGKVKLTVFIEEFLGLCRELYPQ